MQEVEGRFHVHGNDGIPLLLAHAHHKAVFGDTGVVHEDIDAAEVLHNLVHDGLGSFELGGVGGIGLHGYAEGFQFLDRFLSGFIDNEVGESDVGAFGGIFEGNGFANTPGGTGNEGHLVF